MFNPFAAAGLLGGGVDVFPVPIDYSALMESGYSSTGAPATNATIALRWKPTKATTTPLNDMTAHYALTIRKVGSTVTVWKGGTELSTYGGSVGSTYAELVNNVLTYYGGAEAGYYSRLVVVEDSLDYSSFWEASGLVTGLWIPVSLSGLTLHTLLDFSNALDLGEDSSGNGNDWTVNGSPVQTVDTPTDNYCVLNALNHYRQPALSNGNLTATSALANDIAFGTIPIPPSGKWYFEGTSPNASVNCGLGLISTQAMQDSSYTDAVVQYLGNGQIRRDGLANIAYGSSYTGSSSVIGVAVNVDDLEIEFFKDNVSQGLVSETSTPSYDLSGKTWLVSAFFGLSSKVWEFEFGAQGFTYTPPTGFKALSTANLPDPTILRSSTVADIVLREGTGTDDTQITSLGFQPDFVNIKSRNQAYPWYLYDTTRGANNAISTNALAAETTYSGTLTSFGDTVGYTLGYNSYTNGVGNTFLDLCLKAGVDQGFEIVYPVSVTFGSSTVFSHSLGAKPTFIIFKSVSISNHWFVWHTGDNVRLLLNAPDAGMSSTNWCVPTATQVTIAGTLGTGDYIAYVFTDSDIFKAFSYTGNGSVDGPFVNLGGRPLAIPFLKNTATTNGWKNIDSARSPNNPIDVELQPHLPDAELGSAGSNFTSIGYKVTSTGGAFNGSGNLIVGLAILESTKYSNAF